MGAGTTRGNLTMYHSLVRPHACICLYICMCVSVCACGHICVLVCAHDNEREGEREGGGRVRG